MIYVDDMRAPHGRMIMCHMIADDHDELLEFGRRLGLRPSWLQYAGSYKEHFDLSLGKRTLAVKMGAREITQKELAEMIRERRRAEHGEKEKLQA